MQVRNHSCPGPTDFVASTRHDRIWYSIQSPLIAAGNVSKLLWPSRQKIAERPHELKKSLGVDDYLRNFDTSKNAVTYRGDEYYLQPMIDAIGELHKKPQPRQTRNLETDHNLRIATHTIPFFLIRLTLSDF